MKIKQAGLLAHRATLLGSLAFGIFAPGTALAQGQVKPHKNISFSLEVRHDSNVARTSDSVAATRGLKKADERVTPGVEIDIQRPMGRNTLSVNGFVGYDIYRRNSRLNRERVGLSAIAGINAGPCLVTLSPGIERRQSELSNISFVNAPGDDSYRNTQTTQNYSGEVRCGRRTGLRPLVRYERVIGDNSSFARRISDFRSNKYSVGVGYANPTLGDFTVTVDRDETNYPHRSQLGANPFGGFRSDDIKVTAQRDIGAFVVANASLAYTHLRPDLASVRDYNGLSWSLGATVRPVPRLSLMLATNNSVQPSLGAAAVYQRSRNVSLDASYALTSRTSLKGGISQARHRYEGATAVYGPLLTDDALTRVSAGASYDWNRKVQLNLDVGHEHRNANGSIYDYNSSYVAFTARYKL